MEPDNGRQSSEAPSSSSDFYSTSVRTANLQESRPPAPTVPPSQPVQQNHDGAAAMLDNHDADDEDTSDAMDLSDSSTAPSPIVQPMNVNQAGSKRKLGDEQNVAASSLTVRDDGVKKIKLSMPQAQQATNCNRPVHFPIQIWQRIFLNLPPAMLGRFLRVSRDFNRILTQTRATPTSNQNLLPVMESEAIWTHARKTHMHNLPKPLPSCSELKMLQLIGGRTCQFCHRELLRLHATTPFNGGPGLGGLRTVWPFAIRACGACLEKNTLKDIDILQSSAKDLRFGLPYIFLTPDLHFVPASQRQQPGGIPPNLRASKVYYTGDIQRIRAELADAETFGQGAAEEWRKGLPSKGQGEMAAAARWERWEASIPLGKDLPQVLREYDVPSFSHNPAQEQLRLTAGAINGMQLPVSVANGSHAVTYTSPPFQNGYLFGQQYPVEHPPLQQPQRAVRDPNEVMAIRTARQRDIERLCMDLEPPLEPAALQHIQAYQDAMQINQPMTDGFWESVLKPRILAQREAAELHEHQRQQRAAALNAGVNAPADLDFTKSGKELRDKDYERQQEPLRKRLGEYADEYIERKQNGADHLDKATCATFAVNAVLHVYQRYHQDKEVGALPSIDTCARPGSAQGASIQDPFLSLDNMKWVYDNKIRPWTDQYRREPFLCADCTEDRRPKFFAFEGLVQHYGAKHTTAFSKGNVVVQWENAEWPEEPPFHRHPSRFIVGDKKTHGRPRNTPQTNQRGPVAAPGPSRLLSDNPLFANHGSNHAQATNGSYATPDPAYQDGGNEYAFPGLAKSSVDVSEHAQVNKFSNDVREFWDALEGIRGLLDCIRLQAAIRHAVIRFWETFRFKPSLDLVTDALATNAQVLPIKHASGLACQCCVAAENANYQCYYARVRNVKLYTTSSLVTHFKLAHPEHNGSAYPDWTIHMIECPEDSMIRELLSAPGMDEKKLGILHDAFQWAIPNQFPETPRALETGANNDLSSRILARLDKKPKKAKKKGSRGAKRTHASVRGSSSEAVPEPMEHEYDPKRPMNGATEKANFDPARYDTDISRARANVSSVGTTPVNLGPSPTASNSMSGFQSQHRKSPPNDAERDRNPSVGHEEPRSSTSRPTASVTMPPLDTLDISSLLASLRPKLQPAPGGTPPKATINRSDSGPNYVVAHPYDQTYAATNVVREDAHLQTRFSAQPDFGTSFEQHPRYEQPRIHPAANSNTQSFQHNRGRTYVEPVYPQAPSPPRYRYYYDEGVNPPHLHPGQSAPALREQPVQYVQLPPEHYDRPPPTYYNDYARQPSAVEPMYVDAHGRPLYRVPVDSAPAPIQYLPHPHEQQLQRQHYAPRPQQVYYTYENQSATQLPPPPPPGAEQHPPAHPRPNFY